VSTLVLIGGFTLLFMLRVPATTAIGVAALAALLVKGDSLTDIPRFMVNGVDSFILISIPFFILAGNLFNVSGATNRIFEFARVIFGRVPGGLGQATIGSSFIFSGMSGAALADIAGLGTITMKAMRSAHYREGFAAATVLAASVLGPIIPPSIMFIVYAMLMNTSIGRLFAAGIAAGLVIATFLSAFIAWRALTGRDVCPHVPPVTAPEVARTVARAFWSLLAPVVILGAMRTGVVTPTEAGAIAVVYALFLCLVHRSFDLRETTRAIAASAIMSASIVYLIAVSTLMGHILTTSGVAQALVAAISGVTDERWVVLLLINLALLLLGCFLETAPAMLIAVPLLLPIAREFDIDTVHLGIVVCFNLIIGIITPPMGIGLFTMASVARMSVEEVTRSVLPYLIPLLAALVVLTYIPAASLWLPNLIFGPSR